MNAPARDVRGALARAALAVGVALVLLPALLHARVPLAPLPFWDSDPLIAPPALAAPRGSALIDLFTASLDSMGPTASVMLSMVGLAGAVLVLALSPKGVSPLAGTLALIGSAALLWGLWREPSMERTRLTCNWLAAVWGGLAVWHLGADRRWRALVVGVLLAFLLVLAVKGALQVAVEHEATIATFEQDRDAILQSRGWQPGSPAALAYERRLRQPEASGWFGLSNVFGTFMACGLVAGTALAARARRPDKAGALGGGLLALVCLVGLAMSKSKGGIGAACAGFALLALAGFARRRGWAAHRLADRTAGLIAVGCGAAVLLAVVLRGALGPGVKELSLLFRWYYLEASWRIFMNNPITGVGPDGFQPAYARFKHPLSPEEVASPHSIGADYLCTIGIAGLAWVALAAWWTHRAGPGLLASPGDAPAPGETTGRLRLSRPVAYCMLGVIAGAAVLPQVIAPATTVALTIATLASPADPVPTWAMALGLGAEIALAGTWGLLAWFLARAHFAAQSAAAIGAVVLWTHAQIEMTPVQASSAPLFMLLLGALVSPPKPRALAAAARPHEPEAKFSRWGVPLAVAPFAFLPLLVSAGARMWHTERMLLDCARAVAPTGEVLRDLTRLRSEPLSDRERARRMENIDARVLEIVGNERTRLPTFEDRVNFASMRAAIRAAHETSLVIVLWEHRDRTLDQLAIRRALIALAGARAGPASGFAARRIDEAAVSALQLSDRSIRALPECAALWLLLGDVLAECRSLGLDPSKTPTVPDWPADTSSDAWCRAHELDPNSPAPVDRLLDEAVREADAQEAAKWAEVRLLIDENSRLDSTRRLPARERSWLGGVAAGRPLTPRPTPSRNVPATMPPNPPGS
ncbi:MAG: O-antigen ligase family protein [Phycisphaerales bacterium]|nr:O-antigen ligase family protein [Phycisphaerales bacterium]